MKALIFVLTCLIFCTLCSSACKKDENKPNDSDTSGVVLLRNKSLNEIKSILLGNWKIHYSEGGITGTIKTIHENSSFRYLSNDSVYIVFSNIPNTADKAKLTKQETAFGYNAWIIEFNLLNGVKNHLVVDHTFNDTLALVQNAIDGVGFALTKQP